LTTEFQRVGIELESAEASEAWLRGHGAAMLRQRLHRGRGSY
jgi:hypothetical protein